VKPKSDSRFFEVVAAQRKKWDEIAGQAIRSRAQQVSHHSQAVARAVSDLAARDAVAQHTMVGQLDPPERRAADHRLLQQWRQESVPQAPSDLVEWRRWFIDADGRSLDRGSGEIPIKIAVFNNGSLGFVELEMKVEGLLDTYTNLKKFCSCGGERQRALAGKSGDNDAAGTLS
jgi:hypothetical protein